MKRMKFIFGGVLILVAVVYLIATSTSANAQYFHTVDELVNYPASNLDRQLRVSGAVLGDSISYDSQTLTLVFSIAHVPDSSRQIEDEGGLAEVLSQAVNDPNRSHLKVSYTGVKPDLLRHEAQAIMTGHLGEDGVFYADELLLKCPTKYEEAVPQQTGN
jgi:cytochrome c-type biogenesis protein CcmE